MKKLVNGFVVVLIAFCVFSIMVAFYTALWNSMAPVFGIDIQLTMWQVVKLWLLIISIKYVIFNKSNFSELKASVKKIKKEKA